MHAVSTSSASEVCVSFGQNYFQKVLVPYSQLKDFLECHG